MSNNAEKLRELLVRTRTKDSKKALPSKENIAELRASEISRLTKTGQLLVLRRSTVRSIVSELEGES